MLILLYLMADVNACILFRALRDYSFCLFLFALLCFVLFLAGRNIPWLIVEGDLGTSLEWRTPCVYVYDSVLMVLNGLSRLCVSEQVGNGSTPAVTTQIPGVCAHSTLSFLCLSGNKVPHA